MTLNNAMRTAVAIVLMPLAGQAVASDEWIADANGCKIWAASVKPDVSVTWSGACKDGYADGTGTLQWMTDGALTSTFEGKLSGGKPNGKGKETAVKGDSFEGDFADGLREGKGVAIYADGARYEGNYAADKRTGKGVYIWADGRRYVGDYAAGKRTGKGVMTFANGDRYEGDFVDDKRTGKGSYAWVSGDHYEGDFVDGKLEGKGVLDKANGDHYEGYLKAGNFDGLGKLTHNGRPWLEGEFKDGKLVTPRYISDTPASFNIRGCAPHYTKEALEAKEGGVARVKFEIDADGKLLSAALSQSTGFPDLDQATIAALSRCAFKSAIKDGKTMASTFSVEYEWNPAPPKVSPILTKLKDDEGVVLIDVRIVLAKNLERPKEILKQGGQEATEIRLRNLATQKKYSAKFDDGIGIFVVPEGDYCLASFYGRYYWDKKNWDSYFELCKGESIPIKKGVINNAGEWWIARALPTDEDPYHSKVVTFGAFENAARTLQSAVNEHPELLEN